MKAQELLDLADKIDADAHARSAKLRSMAREISPNASDCFKEAQRHCQRVEQRNHGKRREIST